MEGKIRLSLPRVTSRRYRHDSKLPHRLNKRTTAAIAASALFAGFVQVSSTQTPQPGQVASSRTEDIALYVGISKQLARLRELASRPTPQNEADRMWLHQDILEAVTAGSLQVDATTAQIDFEITRVNALRSSLADSRDRTVNRLNLAGLIAGGSLGTLSSGLQLSQSQTHNSSLIGISAGALTSGFGLAGIRAQHGHSHVLTTRSNMLAELFGREALPDSRYPPAIEAFLDQVPPASIDGRTRRAHLIAAWVADERIDLPQSSSGQQQVERLTSRPAQGIEESIDDLETRVSMLADLRATISLMKQDLARLLLSLPKAEAGQPY